MSFGFSRTVSPAAKSQRERVHRLKSIRVSEISSVDRAASRGASIVLLKNDRASATVGRHPAQQTEESSMSGHPLSIAKRAVEAVSNGEISENRFGAIMKQLALAMFPSARSESEVMRKFFDTVVGKSMLVARPKHEPRQEAALRKAEERPGEEDDTPHDGGDDDEQESDHDRFELMVTGAMKEHQCSRSRAGDLVRSTPEGKALWERAKAERGGVPHIRHARP